jgi:hypothetical protein
MSLSVQKVERSPRKSVALLEAMGFDCEEMREKERYEESEGELKPCERYEESESELKLCERM